MSDSTINYLNSDIVKELEESFGGKLYALPPRFTSAYCIQLDGTGVALFIVTHPNHSLIIIGQSLDNASHYSTCYEHNKPGSLVSGIVHTMRRLHNDRAKQQENLLSFITYNED